MCERGYRLTTALGNTPGVNISTLLINVAVIEYGFAIPGLFRSIHAAALGG